MRAFVLLGFSVWVLVLVAAWIIRDLMSPQWWLVSGAVFWWLYRLTSYAHDPNPLDRPPNPGPLRLVNMIVANAAVLSFAAAVFHLIYRFTAQ